MEFVLVELILSKLIYNDFDICQGRIYASFKEEREQGQIKIINSIPTRWTRIRKKLIQKLVSKSNNLQHNIPSPCIMQIHLVRNSTSSRFGKNPSIFNLCEFIQLVRMKKCMYNSKYSHNGNINLVRYSVNAFFPRPKNCIIRTRCTFKILSSQLILSFNHQVTFI